MGPVGSRGGGRHGGGLGLTAVAAAAATRAAVAAASLAAVAAAPLAAVAAAAAAATAAATSPFLLLLPLSSPFFAPLLLRGC